MSTNYESKIGILILVDIVNFTQQASKYGDVKLRGFIDKIESQISDISEKKGIHFIKSIGDAFLLFIDKADIPGMNLFLEFVSELRDKSIQGILDFEEFISDLRCVAHFGTFQFKFENDKIIDLQGAEGIKVFRIEKEAGRYEVVITGQIFELIKMTLDEKKIDYIEMGQKIFKGLSNHPILLYKLIFPEKNLSSDLLEQEMKSLEKKCQTIPVFGGLFPDISMEKNFINLSIKGEMKPDYYYMDVEKRRKIIETLEVEDREEKFERMKEHDSCFLSAKEMYETYMRGVIFGLPGSGKTTIMRYFAYRDFLENQKKSTIEEKRAILFFYCFSALPYKEWLKMAKKKVEPDMEDIESILAYFVYHFLFGKKNHSSLTEKERREFYKAEKAVIKAYNQGRLTLLMDGLDESENPTVKKSILDLYRRLFKDFSWNDNKIYLTSRYLEKEDFLDDFSKSLFEVCSLDMEQLRQIARYFYGSDSPLYRKFDDVVWKEEIATKIGGTPVTAILLLAYFKRFLRFENRYVMYDVLIKFILIKIWKLVKKSNFDSDII
jgi:GTPase SAR1 family protein